MPTECSSELFEFAPVEGRRVVAGFDGGAITPDAGALLLGQADKAIGLSERLAACFTDRRNHELIEHQVSTLVMQRVFGIALGYEDLNDHDELRHDPVLAVCACPHPSARPATTSMISPVTTRSTHLTAMWFHSRLRESVFMRPGPISPIPTQPLRRNQQKNRQRHHQRRRGGNRRIEVFAQAHEHLHRQRALLWPRHEQRDQQLVERGDEREGRA